MNKGDFNFNETLTLWFCKLAVKAVKKKSSLELMQSLPAACLVPERTELEVKNPGLVCVVDICT